jgi:hypothetical protein
MNTRKHMIFLTRRAHLTKKILWRYEPKHQQNWNKLIQEITYILLML